MSRKEASRFTKQLGAFVQQNTTSKPSTWIGTVLLVNKDYTRCTVRIEGRGDLVGIPCFGVPKIGTTALVLFLNDSYSNPLAICNPMNVLDEEAVRTIKGRNARNFHSNGDFSRGSSGYRGDFIFDDSITSKNIDTIIKYTDLKTGKVYTLHANKSTEVTWENGVTASLEIPEKLNSGGTHITCKFTDKNKKPLPDKNVLIHCYGKGYGAVTDKDGVAHYYYFPQQPYTCDGYSAVLPYKGSYLEFDCPIIQDADAPDDFFKVQAYYLCNKGQLKIEVHDKKNGKVVKNVPSTMASDYQLWNANSEKWLVNREVYKKTEDLHEVTIRFTNNGNLPIRLDGILVHDECGDYNYYKSREDLING